MFFKPEATAMGTLASNEWSVPPAEKVRAWIEEAHGTDFACLQAQMEAWYGEEARVRLEYFLSPGPPPPR